jgi:hypothetical protein
MRAGLRSIATVMVITSVIAFWLALSRERRLLGPDEPVLFLWFFAWALLGAFVLFIGPAIVWFLVVPRFSLRLAGGNRYRQQRILPCAIRTPFPAGAKILARCSLAVNHEVSGRFPEAKALYRSILNDVEIAVTHR